MRLYPGTKVYLVSECGDQDATDDFTLLNLSNAVKSGLRLDQYAIFTDKAEADEEAKRRQAVQRIKEVLERMEVKELVAMEGALSGKKYCPECHNEVETTGQTDLYTNGIRPVDSHQRCDFCDPTPF